MIVNYFELGGIDRAVVVGGSSQCTICNLISGLVKINNVNMHVLCLDPNNDSHDRSRDSKEILLSVCTLSATDLQHKDGRKAYQELMALMPSNMAVEFNTLSNASDADCLVNRALVRNLLWKLQLSLNRTFGEHLWYHSSKRVSEYKFLAKMCRAIVLTLRFPLPLTAFHFCKW